MPTLKRWTPLTFISPSHYVDTDEFWSSFDLEDWSQSKYQWTQDSWNGLRDFAQLPRETVRMGRGDCEDYALVAISWAKANHRDRVGLAFCWEWPYPWPTHVIAFDNERVYSSGRIFTKSVREWTDDSERYGFALKRRVR